MFLHEWKQIDDKTACMEVPGGMIYRYEWLEENGNGISLASSMVFVPMTKEAILDLKFGGE